MLNKKENGMKTRKHVLSFLLVLVAGLMGPQARGAGFYAHIDSVTPTQHSGQCPTTLQLKGRISAPAGQATLVEIKIDQIVPPGVTVPPSYGSDLTFSYTGSGENVVTNIDRSIEVYGAKAIRIQIRKPTGTWSMTAPEGETSNRVDLSFSCVGPVAALLKKKEVNVQSVQQPPSRPEQLTATASKQIGIHNTTTVKLGWQPPVSLIPVDSFKIERKIQGQSGGFVIIAQMQKPQNGPLPTSYDDTGLDYNKTYIYRMKATNAFGESPYSNQATVHTQAADIAGTMAKLKPAQPSGLRAQAVGPGKVALHWMVAPGNPMETGAIKGFGFSILKPGEMWLPAGKMPVANHQTTGSFSYNYESSSLNAGKKYSFRVFSYKDEAMQQVSDYSNEAQVTMPGDTSTPPKMGGQPAATLPGAGAAKKSMIR
jgi:hypothetical protein